MGEILKLPLQTSKFGYRRVRKRGNIAEDPGQLHLFPQPTAQILNFAPDLSWFEQALMLDERGDSKAAEFYLKAIAEHDCVADAYCNLGIIESHKGNKTKAFDCFTSALRHDPRHTEAHFNLGNLYFDMDDFRLAQVHYELAAEVDCLFASVYFNLALAQAINDDLTAAVATLGRYRELVSEEEARNAGDLLKNLRESLAAARNRKHSS